MNIIEKQTELGRSLYEINSNTLKELATVQRESVEKYFETNRTFGERLPEIKSVTDFLALQREYGETLWSNAKDSVESQNEIVRTAFEEASSAMKTVFTPETEEAPKPKAKSKPKAKAKKPATAAA